MFAGPLFTREAITVPRQSRHFLIRSVYVGALFVLMYTAAQATFGLQAVRNIGEIARFGAIVFQVFSVVQLTLVLFFGVLFAAGRVAQEKDRGTLLLLLMTDLRNHELVLGKLAASLLIVAVLLGISVPVMCSLLLLGGVSPGQVAMSVLLSGAAGLAAGAWGNLVAFWKDKTFQTLAIGVLGLVLFVGGTEVVAAILRTTVGPTAAIWVELINPYRGMLAILDPLADIPGAPGHPAMELISVGWSCLIAIVLLTTTTVMVRVWNPSQGLHTAPKQEDDTAAAPARTHREIWANPIVWREICTRAYGRRIIFIKLAYFLIAALLLGSALRTGDPTRLVLGMLPAEGFAVIGLTLVTLLMIDAQAVTAFTTERDTGTLELLMVTDITAREFIVGKLEGVLYNTKELIAVPILYLTWMLTQGRLALEYYVYLVIGMAVLSLFAAMLGLHSGLTYKSSRTAIINALGTIFFLFVGIFICLMLIVQARSSFSLQLPCFLVFILGGSVGLWLSLTKRNPSPALTLAAGVLPFCTFYAITSFLLGQTLGVCLFISAAYGFTTIAMLIPAITSFDTALGQSRRGVE